MSHDDSAIKNKQPKVYFEQYLLNSAEPFDDVFNDTYGFETELVEDSQSMKQLIRNMAQKSRNRYS